jgi:hypothetical protein
MALKDAAEVLEEEVEKASDVERAARHSDERLSKMTSPGLIGKLKTSNNVSQVILPGLI